MTDAPRGLNGSSWYLIAIGCVLALPSTFLLIASDPLDELDAAIDLPLLIVPAATVAAGVLLRTRRRWRVWEASSALVIASALFVLLQFHSVVSKTVLMLFYPAFSPFVVAWLVPLYVITRPAARAWVQANSDDV